MNGFADHGLDEGAFGEKKGFSEGLRTFDAFRMSSIAIPLSRTQLLIPCQLKPNPPIPGAPPPVATQPSS